jgi:AcrR family transcriptional regulator
MSTGVDRRAALKARHRDAILSAARELIQERGGPSFGVDELSARADVARRTVFNHFASLDDVLISVCESDILVVVDQFRAAVNSRPAGEAPPRSMYDDIARAVRSIDIPPVIVQVIRTLGAPGSKGARRGMLSQAALERATTGLTDEIRRQNPDTNLLDSELLVQFLTAGLVVIGRHWFRRTGGNLDERGRAEWSGLVEELLTNLRPAHSPALSRSTALDPGEND